MEDNLETNQEIEDLKSAQDADMLTELNRQRMEEHRQKTRDDRFEFGEEFLIPNPYKSAVVDRQTGNEGLDGRKRGPGPNYIRRG